MIAAGFTAILAYVSKNFGNKMFPANQRQWQD
jgi:hypothetical protein